MNTTIIRRLRCLGSAALCALLTVPAMAQVSIDPPDCDIVLNQGGTVVQDVTVCIPGENVECKADVYFLADTTGSMSSVINNVKTNAAAITQSLLNKANCDLQIGVGNYKDFPFDPFAFQHQLDVTDNQAGIVAAINAWGATGGSDLSEGQFYALHQIATDPGIGFRPDAARIVVWFGDAPAHDPVCQALTGLGFDLTEAIVTSALATGGPGGTAMTVIAISAPTGQVGALNGDPLLDAGDYNAFCTPGGTPNQALNIATATGGIDTAVGNPAEVTAAILESIDIVLSMVDVTLKPVGAIADFVTNINPPSFPNVLLPTSPDEEVCVTFQVTFSDKACIENESSFDGFLEANLDGLTAAQKSVNVTQPHCALALCKSALGFSSLSAPIPGGSANDKFLVDPALMFDVLLDDIPVFPIPVHPMLLGTKVYMQVLMHNPIDFPNDPIKSTAGLEITIGDGTLGKQYGVDSGMSIWLAHPADLGGTLEMHFSINWN